MRCAVISDALENLIQTAERSGQSISHNVMSRVYTPSELRKAFTDQTIGPLNDAQWFSLVGPVLPAKPATHQPAADGGMVAWWR